MNYHRSPLRQLIFRTLLYFAITIFIFDFHFYRYGIDIRLGKIMHGIVANLEQEASQNLEQIKYCPSCSQKHRKGILRTKKQKTTA